jgi:hypothetical protein
MVMTVPAATFDPAVAEHEDPAAAAVVQEMMLEPAVQVVEEVLGVTENKAQVVDAPEYE